MYLHFRLPGYGKWIREQMKELSRLYKSLYRIDVVEIVHARKIYAWINCIANNTVGLPNLQNLADGLKTLTLKTFSGDVFQLLLRQNGRLKCNLQGHYAWAFCRGVEFMAVFIMMEWIIKELFVEITCIFLTAQENSLMLFSFLFLVLLLDALSGSKLNQCI